MPRFDPPDQNDANDPHDGEDKNEHDDEDHQGEPQQDDGRDDHEDRGAPNEPDAQRPAPLTPKEEERIREAVSRGMPMRAVAADPNIRGSLEQVRRVVRRARQDDPAFEARLLRRSWRPASLDQTIAVLASDAAADELTPPGVFVDAGVPRDAERFCRFATSPTETFHLFRTPDGSVIPVRVGGRERRPTRARRAGSAARRRAVRRQWRLLAAVAMALLVVLIALLLAAPWKARAAALAMPPTAVERVNDG
jgi:hypothetical protein